MKNLIDAAQSFVEKAKKEEIYGKRMTSEEMMILEMTLDITLPKWYKDLLTQVPIIGIEFNYNGYRNIRISDDKTICAEALDSYPGTNFFEEEYLCFGEDLTKRNDYYYLDLKNTKSIPLYRGSNNANGKFEDVSVDESELVATELIDVFLGATF